MPQPNDARHYEFVNDLYREAFPPAERRPLSSVVALQNDPAALFSLYLLKKGTDFIGFITLWSIEDFIFIEHFAIAQACRGLGYGSEVLVLLKNKYNNIILEVEPDKAPAAIKRIDFYSKAGFTLWRSLNYRQPPYGRDGYPVSLYIMSWGRAFTVSRMKAALSLILHIVYEVPHAGLPLG